MTSKGHRLSSSYMDDRIKKFEKWDNIELYLMKSLRILLLIIQLIISLTLFTGFIISIIDSNIYNVVEKVVVIINQINPTKTAVFLILGSALILIGNKLLYTVLEFINKK